MKKAFLISLISFTSLLYPQYNHHFNYTVVDSNNIKGFLNNYGTLNPRSYDRGFYWNQLIDDKTIIFDQGIWVVGKRSIDTVLAISEWSTVFSPGPIIDGQAGMLIHPEDSLRFRVYKINKNDNNSNPDYAEWPIDFGAPVNSDNSPKIYGDQTHWCVYNALDSTSPARQNFLQHGPIPPVPIEVQQLVYVKKGHSSDFEDIFSNTVFLEYTIINKGLFNIDSAFIGFWTDIDFSTAMMNIPAVDSTNQLGYCWNENNYTTSSNPASGYTLLYGPVEPSQGSTAVFKGRTINNFRNIPLYSFHGIGDDAIRDSLMEMAFTVNNAWNYARGLSKNGDPVINPITGQVTRFPFNGDPVTGTGWLFPSPWVGGAAGFAFFTGPVFLAPSDTQWVMLALIPALGRNNLESVTLMRRKAALLHSLPYDSLAFGTTPYFITGINDDANIIPGEYSLSQNYPNPFNPSTQIVYSIPNQCRASIKIFDIIGREAATMVNEEKPAGTYSVNFDGSNFASGVYYYQIRAGEFVDTKKMVLLK